jgi:hypothetical protein
MGSCSTRSMRRRIRSRLYHSPRSAARPTPASLPICHGVAAASHSPCSSCESSPSSRILCCAQGSWLTSCRRHRPERRDDYPTQDPSGLCSVVLVMHSFTYWIYCAGYHQSTLLWLLLFKILFYCTRVIVRFSCGACVGTAS